jgi:hypothetical protein
MSRGTIIKIIVIFALIVVVAVGYSMMKGNAATLPPAAS